jgi:hypothetical protein
MKIIRLSASNVMRLRAVEIEPSGTVQIVAGKNGAGKSSLLNALWLALGGGAASRGIAKPIREGEDHAEVQLDLGDLIVTRTWDEHGRTTLTVKAPDGAVYKSPQALLDQMVGKLSFDPLAFTRLSAREQRDALLDLLGLDFAAQDAERQRLYDVRLDTGRRMHAFGDLPKLDKGAPLVEKSSGDIIDRLRESNRIRQQESALRHQVREREDRIAHIHRRLDALRDEITALEAESTGHSEAITETQAEIAALPPQEDMGALEGELAQVEDHNAAARENQRIAQAREQQQALEEEYTDLGRQISAIDNAKAKAIAAAEMPVEGLGFDESGVTFGGVPFAQASAAEQIRVSLGMACALNPTLRVIRIMDGSLLDSDSMALVRAAAEEYDMQVFLEVVGDGGDDPAAVVIEDGSVVSR